MLALTFAGILAVIVALPVNDDTRGTKGPKTTQAEEERQAAELREQSGLSK